MEDISVTDDSPTVDISSAVASFTGDTYKMYLKRIQRKKKLKKKLLSVFVLQDKI